MGKTDQPAVDSHPVREGKSNFRKFQTTSSNRTVSELARMVQEGIIRTDPPYQRGSVWGETRKRNLIMSLTMGVPIGNIFINDRSHGMGDYYLVDGKQRLETVNDFFADRFKVPSEWFASELVDSDKDEIHFSDLTVPGQRFWKTSATLAVTETKLMDDEISTAEEKEAELFDLINFAGVAQGASDMIDETSPESIRKHVEDSSPHEFTEPVREMIESHIQTLMDSGNWAGFRNDPAAIKQVSKYGYVIGVLSEGPVVNQDNIREAEYNLRDAIGNLTGPTDVKQFEQILNSINSDVDGDLISREAVIRSIRGEQ